MTKTVKILIGIGIGIVAFIVLGFGFTIYLSYKGARVPVYQTEITDFEMQKPKAKFYAEETQSKMQKLLDTLGVKTLKCFIFHTKDLYIRICISFWTLVVSASDSL